jgi:hypothetical protein
MTHVSIKATREGLQGHVTSSGYVIDTHVPFVALPAKDALYRCVKITNQLNGKQCYAMVLDVGPWNIEDNSYVFYGARPQAESGTDSFNRQTNGAGIDLGEKVWSMLGMTDNTLVTWEFVS